MCIDRGRRHKVAELSEVPRQLHALSPPRVSVALHDRDMRGLLDTLSSLKVNVPDDNACTQIFGQSTRTFITTTVANDESKTGRKSVLADLMNPVAHTNAQYENVRFAAPILSLW